MRIIYPVGLTQEIQVALGAGAILLNCAIYAWVVRRLRSGDQAAAQIQSERETKSNTG